VTLPAGLPDWRRHLLTDPQTSGGLLVACAADRAAEIVDFAQKAGYAAARIVGRVQEGDPSVKVAD